METGPDIDLPAIAAALERSYGVAVDDIAFLPLGADPDAAAREARDYLLRTMREIGVAETAAP